MSQDSDGIQEALEHTLQVSVALISEHRRNRFTRSTAALKDEAASIRASTTITDAQLALARTALGGELADVVRIATLSNARPAVDAAAVAPRRSSRARRSPARAEREIERERGR